MRSVKSFIAAGAAIFLSSAAFAADMAIAPPPYAAPVVEDFGGWYLRGDIGFSNQRVDRLNNALDANVTSSVQTNNFNTAGIFGLGVGYRFNNWFRADVTGEYRGNSQFFGKDLNTFPAASAPIPITPPSRNGSFSATPMSISAPGGASPRSSAPASAERGLRLQGFTDAGIANNGGVASPSLAFGDSASKWNLAWAVHAGLAYRVTPNFTVELAYRYLDMGDGLTGDLRTFDGTNNINNPITFKNITSHDLKLGVRWDLISPQVYAPPLIRKG